MYICPYCDRDDFPTLDDQRAHIGDAHPGMGLNVCGVCKKSYSSRGNMVTHMKIHAGEKTHVCTVCNSRFVYQSYLTTHMRIHTGEKPHSCKTCGARFGQTGTLKDHMLVHTRERSHVCAVCNKGFGRLQNLHKHMRVHTGERRYICTACHNRYGYSNTLKSHIQNCHPYLYEMNSVLTSMMKQPENRFPDFEHAKNYISDLFSQPPPVNRSGRCPHCGETVNHLELHIGICPWRQGPSWQ